MVLKGFCFPKIAAFMMKNVWKRCIHLSANKKSYILHKCTDCTGAKNTNKYEKIIRRHQYIVPLMAEKQYSLRQHNKPAIKGGYSWLKHHNNKISNLSSDLGGNLCSSFFFFWLLIVYAIILSGQHASLV